MRDTKTQVPEAQKSFKIAPRGSKSIQKAALKRWCYRGRLRTSFFSNICDFLMIFGFPNAPKIHGKTLQIRCFKTTRFWIRISNGFSLFWPPKSKATSSNLRIFIENANFAKIIVFPRGNHYFSGSEPRKIYQNWMLKRNEK